MSTSPPSNANAHEPRRGREARRSARAQRGVASIPYITRAIPTTEMVSEEGLAIIERNAETLLQEVGIAFRDYPQALERFKAVGADVKGERVRFPRGLAVLSVYLAFFLALSGIGFLLANPISNQVAAFSSNVPHLVRHANNSLAELQTTLNEDGVHVQFHKQGETALQTLGDKVTKASSSIVSFGGGLLTEVVTGGFDVLLVFVLSIYMLVYGPRIGRLVRRAMPDGDGTPEDDYPTLVQNAVARYVGGQLLFSIIMGTTAGLALYLFGVLGIFPAGSKYAVVFGVFFGVMELVPYLGPFIGALPPVLVALFTDPISAVWVTLLFVGLQQLEGHLVAPQIFGHTLRINPLLVIFALLIGLQVQGIVGALIALPILSVLRETTVYLGRHVVLEPWDNRPDGIL